MSVELMFHFAPGKNREIIDYLQTPESGAIKVIDPSCGSKHHIYHFSDSTVRILPFMDQHSITIYADERDKAFHAKSKLEEATGIKLEGVI